MSSHVGEVVDVENSRTNLVLVLLWLGAGSPEGVKKLVSASLCECPPWLRGTLGGSFSGTYDRP
jgi:hypothetical protein